MIFKVKNLEIEICEKTGAILKIENRKRTLTAEGEGLPLLTVYLMDEAGNREVIDADTAEDIRFVRGENRAEIYFSGIGGKALDALAAFFVSDGDGMLHATVSVQNQTGKRLELVNFVRFFAPVDLIKNGGDSVVFTPFTEGTLLEDIYLRDKFMGTVYRDMDFRLDGIMGKYPCVAPYQMLAYYSEKGGLYFAAHDDNLHIKQLEAYAKDGKICFMHQVMAGGAKGTWALSYDIVLGGFEGDWYDAAEIYRSWFEKSALCPVRLEENKRMPAWMEDSPIVLIFPIRGTGSDHDPMLPNCYYPYENAAAYINRLGEKLGCRVMGLMCHWEGTAPWAPPHVWPPFGSEQSFRNAVGQMHAAGNLVGVYCSGIGWTTHSYIDTDKKDIFSAWYEEENIESCLVVKPDGTKDDLRCMENIRDFYEMCPSVQRVKDIAVSEVEKIAEAGVDFCQYFDQDWGGMTKPCYSKEHGHPDAPGNWLVKEIKNLQKQMNAHIREMGSEMILGTEGAATEPFMGELPFNDLRFFKGYYYGAPVPAWAYISHEYTSNFAGNGGNIAVALDIRANPEHLPFTYGYAFVQGSVLTAVLGSGGRLHWSWNCDEKEYGLPENQEQLWEYLAHLNRWRRGHGKNFLLYGRMEKPDPVSGLASFSLIRPDGSTAEYPDLLFTKWNYKDRKVQFVLNYLYNDKTFSLDKDVILFESPEGEGRKIAAGEAITLPALSACMVEPV